MCLIIFCPTPILRTTRTAGDFSAQSAVAFAVRQRPSTSPAESGLRERRRVRVYCLYQISSRCRRHEGEKKSRQIHSNFECGADAIRLAIIVHTSIAPHRHLCERHPKTVLRGNSKYTHDMCGSIPIMRVTIIKSQYIQLNARVNNRLSLIRRWRRAPFFVN